MTVAQQRTLDEIKNRIEYFDFYGKPDQYEIKKFEVKELENGDVWVSFTTGMRDDEGTLGQVYCRKHRFTMIGKRGGLYVYEGKTTDTVRQVRYTVFQFMNYRWEH